MQFFIFLQCFPLRFSKELFNPFPNDKYKTLRKLKKFADDNFKFNENSRKFSIRVENTVGKEEIARYEQFLLFPQCFQKTCTANQGLFGKGLNTKQISSIITKYVRLTKP